MTRSLDEGLCTVTMPTTYRESLDSGRYISIRTSLRIKLHGSSRLPRSAEAWSRQITLITIWTRCVISRLPENSASQTVEFQVKHQTMAIFPNKDSRIWCDICKQRWGTQSLRGQTPAVWITVSEKVNRGLRRAYCQPCSNEIQTWVDGTIWTFKQMQDYALGKVKLDGMES